MLRFLRLLTSCGCLLASSLSVPAGEPGKIAGEFSNPPPERRLRAWWFWTPPYLSPEGTKQDVAAMDAVGMGGVNLMTHGATSGIPKGFNDASPKIPIRSEAYNQLVGSVIADLAARGMKFDTHNVDGYKGAAGPWVTPGQGMRMIRVEATPVSGPQTLTLDWPDQPTGKAQWGNDANQWKRQWPGVLGVNIPPLPPGDRSTFRDIALLAVPGNIKPLNTIETNGDLLNDRDFKKAESLLGRAGAAKRDQIIDLTGRMDSTGHLTWDVPPGEWTLLRFQSEPTGHRSAGLEVDKWDKDLLWDTINRQVGAIIEQNKAYIPGTFQFLVQDSWESSIQTWSANMARVFRERRGYDPVPWLPVLAGVEVNSREESERFLWDFRRTMADQFVYVGWIKLLREWANDRGLGLALEGRPLPGINLSEWWSMADKPMDESWFTKLVPRKEFVAAVADYHGRNVVAMEAHTDLQNLYLEHPGNLKPAADSYFCAGWNQLIPHCYTAQPFDEKPGYRLYGIFNNRSNTWWNQARPYFLSLGRIQTVLQQTSGVADLLIVEDETPSAHFAKFALLDKLPRGFLYDACDASQLAQLQVRDGKIVSPIGKEYSALYYMVPPEPLAGSMGRIRPEILEQLERLADAGARLVTNSPKPTGSPSLQGYPESTERVLALATKLWDGGKIGKPSEIADGLVPDLDGHGELNWTHRRNDEFDAYFMANHAEKPAVHEVTFRVSGRVPELWHPETGQVEPLPVWSEGDGRTKVLLRFDPLESYFVVFRKPSSGQSQHWATLDKTDGGWPHIQHGRAVWVAQKGGRWTLTKADGRVSMVEAKAPPAPFDIPGPWEVTYPPGQGTPEKISLPALQNMIQHENPAIRGFSGTSTYRTTFTVPPALLEPDLAFDLDLGEVQQIAEVRLNGKDLGIAYRQPYQLSTGGALKVGENSLEIEVTNTWLNRMVFQKDLPVEQRLGDPSAWLDEARISKLKGYEPLKDQGYLMDSGLIGPVRLVASRVVQVP